MMRLDIQNIHKLIDSVYHNGRFVCTKGLETNTNYRFQFHDTHYATSRYVWVEVSRNGQWDSGKWTYRLNYSNCPTHFVTADWLGFPPNVSKLMEDCLKHSL